MDTLMIRRSRGGNHNNMRIATGLADNNDDRRKFRAKLETGHAGVVNIQLPRATDPKKRAEWMRVRDELALAIWAIDEADRNPNPENCHDLIVLACGSWEWAQAKAEELTAPPLVAGTPYQDDHTAALQGLYLG